MPEEFINIDSFGIKSINFSVLAVGFMSLQQIFPDSSFSTTSRTDDEHAMPDVKNFIKVNAFSDKLFFRDKTHNVLSCLLACFHQFWRLLILSFSIWEKILNKTNEDGFVVSDNLGEVKVS